MNIIRLQAGIYAVNCYIVYSKNTMDGIVVDPGGDAEAIKNYIEENNISLKSIVLTHGHGDHIGGVKELKEYYNVPVFIHEDDAEMLEDCSKNLSSSMAIGCVELTPDGLLNDNDIIEVGDLEVLILHTPGHTKGGICLKIKDHLISGDTLFNSSIGRTDLYGGNFDTLINSIKTKLLVLPEDTTVLPGHGQPTTIKAEKYGNTFLR
ncbi:MBL fold metallo-hydrolase [Tissierella sp. Yu-01]|uniref:MBL fold metallo-hydrolase n=1 Tax=Tissierella sp. Yu-01 TaxID=3035694 RepID=UPI00240DF24F|nr:MBL fold metallo-hydrolase [Tissierella sp. Yu-01]WFA09844.1 MBL fold metallo-hydrolase [Tissierella sp. Yu-01]